MAKDKDNLKHLMKLASEDRTELLRSEGTSILQQTQREIMDLQQQANFIMYLLTKYAGVSQPIVMTFPAGIGGKPPSPPTTALLSRKERTGMIKAAALDLAKAGKTELSGTDVLDALRDKGVELGVARPASAVGTVLSAMRQFKRVEMNRFKYLGEASEGRVEVKHLL